MRAVLACALLAGALLAASLATPARAQLPPSVAQAMQRNGIPAEAAGLYVADATGGRPLASHNAERAFNPASSIKLLTTYAALELLGPAYTWTTDVLVSGSVRDEVLTGDLVIRGSGDPRLTLESFWLLLKQVRLRGIREIRGDVILDRSYFAVDETDAGRFDNEPTRPYNTPPDALLVNYKAVRLVFMPDPERRRVEVFTEPPHPQIRIQNDLRLDNVPCPDFLGRMAINTLGDGASVRFTVTGAYSQQCGEQDHRVSVLSHQEFVAGLLRETWKDLGGTLSGTVRSAPTPPSARPLVAWTSPSVAEIVRDINKYSNNVMARQVFLTLGAAGQGAPGTTEKGARVVREWLTRKGLEFPELVMENGSGLSRIERISPRSLGELLVAAFRSPVMPELIASMPVVGVDGTLRRRARNADFAGQAHIKGGTLTGVRAMAGYVLDQRGRRVVVVLFINGKVTNASAQPVFDALLSWAHSRAPQGPRPAAPEDK